MPNVQLATDKIMVPKDCHHKPQNLQSCEVTQQRKSTLQMELKLITN